MAVFQVVPVSRTLAASCMKFSGTVESVLTTVSLRYLYVAGNLSLDKSSSFGLISFTSLKASLEYGELPRVLR